MKGDFTRRTFDPARHATSVLEQQGRVHLDSDWNEQQDIDEHLRTVTLTDAVGAAGGPVDDAAFAVTAAGDDVVLSAGRYYVGGTLCENDAPVSVFDQPDLPAHSPFVQRTDGSFLDDGVAIPPAVYLLYLDAWQQLRTVVDDLAIREVALGGPDTAVRRRTVWQARLVEAGAAGSTPPCSVEPAPWAALTAPSSGTLAAWAKPAAAPTSDCDVPLSAPYRGLDNQQYRVEIRDAGGPGTASYVWSRDNGSVVSSWEGAVGPVLTVKTPGRDGSSGFTAGCWAELTDDLHELQGRPGTLVKVKTPQGDQLEIDPTTATGSLDRADFPLHPRVRRWDGFTPVPADGSDAELELGIQVRFGTGALVYRTGDYWSFPARAATHDVEWPQAGTDPAQLTSHGPAHGYARLALLGWDGTAWSLVRDCRPLFASLADQVTLAYVGGDGQTAVPAVGAPATLVGLDRPLVVGVESGGRPLAGAAVEFTVTAGSGQVGGAAGPTQVVTGADGLATAAWAVDSATVAQEVSAALLGGDLVTSRGLPVRFGARLERADLTSYDPATSPSLAGTATVQQAIDRLAATASGGCVTLTLSPGDGWVQALEQLPAGSDAVVCFRPGEYKSDAPAVLKGLGNVSLHGGGASTQVVVGGSEAALLFDHCASIDVHDLSLAVAEYPVGPQKGLHGVLTAVACAEVSVRRVAFSCPAATSARAACLTVRGGGPGDNRPTVTSATVEDCTFMVGHAQDGVLVVDSDRTVVQGCSFTVPELPSGFTLGTFLADKRVRAALTSQLVGRALLDRSATAPPAPAPAPAPGFTTAVPIGNFVVRMNSTVPREQWRALIAQQPPDVADTASADAVQAYVQRLTSSAVDTPTTLPAFNRSIGLLRQGLGATADQVFGTVEGKASLAGLLTGGTVDVQPAAAVVTIARRGISLPAGNAAVRFDSVLSQNTWEAVLATSPPRQQTPVSVARTMRTAAQRMLTDQVFGDRFAAGFRAGLLPRVRSVAGRAIAVVGATIGNVEVSGNQVDTFVEGVHVAGSVRGPAGTPAVFAGSVRVRGNDIQLGVPVELPVAPRGVFVGNANRIVVADNTVTVGRTAAGAGGALAGIHLEGLFGSHLVVRDNFSMNCRTCAFIRQHGNIPAGLWLAADNVSVGGGAAVDAPQVVRVSGNVP